MIPEEREGSSVALFSDESEFLRFRRRLILYFERRGCLAPDLLADDCFKRLAAVVQSGRQPDRVNAFLFGIAGKVYLEHMRDAARLNEPLPDELPSEPDSPSIEESRAIARQVVSSLSPEERELMEAHFFDKLSWKSLSRRFGQTEVALRLRAMRLRNRLMRDFGEQLRSIGLKRRAARQSVQGENR